MMDKLPRQTIVAFAALVPLYMAFFLFLDRPIDLWVRDNFAGTRVHELAAAISLLFCGPAVKIALAAAFIVAIVAVMAGGNRSRPWISCLLFICVSCAVAIIVGEGLKIALGRYRPMMLFDAGQYGLHFFAVDWQLNSTPSGHTYRSFAIMTALSLVFPRGRAIFLAYAVLIGLCRVVVTAHYPSDVLFGAFIGVFAALWTWRLKTNIPAIAPADSAQISDTQITS